MRNAAPAALVLATAGGLAACGGETLCLGDISPPALAIHVRDSLTGLTASRAATGSYRTGAIAGRLSLLGLDSLDLGTFGPPGVYAVEIRAPGYRPWTAEHVEVSPDGPCSVRTTELLARLQLP